ncbi:hypothetical protein BU26DRAFT_592091 [Trematosphaeria pertusa]|uniref:Uncharacterized protein n=1 Tax=Trematosphaeria pertusa TaxID=390896 RepID=A0A6A6IKR5_9PLEO|nr:uncharacterized protein BU26DRAFT_592091 [Trematosphaeria pertusa]KAF2251011.1 hypothetical protein BU26DRAFT_592091 [Trematosphaeria pertusa]
MDPFTAFPLPLVRSGLVVVWPAGSDQPQYFPNTLITLDVVWKHWTNPDGTRTAIDYMDDGGPTPLLVEYDLTTWQYLGPGWGANFGVGNFQAGLPAAGHYQTTAFWPPPAGFDYEDAAVRAMQAFYAGPAAVSRPAQGTSSREAARAQSVAGPGQQQHEVITIPDDEDEQLAPAPAPGLLTPESLPPPAPVRKGPPSALPERKKHLRGTFRSFCDAPVKEQRAFCDKYWPSNQAALEHVEYLGPLFLDFDTSKIYLSSWDSLKVTPVLNGKKVVYEKVRAADEQKLREKRSADLALLNGLGTAKNGDEWKWKAKKKGKKEERTNKRVKVSGRGQPTISLVTPEPEQPRPHPPTPDPEVDAEGDDDSNAAMLQEFAAVRGEVGAGVTSPAAEQSTVEVGDEDEGFDAVMLQEFAAVRGEVEECDGEENEEEEEE